MTTKEEARAGVAELVRRVAKVNLAIDDAVYTLCSLNDRERRLVEGEG